MSDATEPRVRVDRGGERVVVGAESRAPLRLAEDFPDRLRADLRRVTYELYARAEAEGLTFKDDDVEVTIRVEVVGEPVRPEPPEIEVISVPPEVHFVTGGGPLLYRVGDGLRFTHGSADPTEVTCSLCKEILKGMPDEVE